jgi:hypothetical protein
MLRIFSVAEQLLAFQEKLICMELASQSLKHVFHVKRDPCHHSTVHPQVTDGRGSLQMRRVVTNVLKNPHRADKEWSTSLRNGEGIINFHTTKNKLLTQHILHFDCFCGIIKANDSHLFSSSNPVAVFPKKCSPARVNKAFRFPRPFLYCINN